MGEPVRKTIKFRKQATKKRLNKRAIEALPIPPEVNGRTGREYVYDASTPRLAICVLSSGAKSWYWSGRCNGSPIKFKLGDFPEITPEQAKKLATKVSAQVAEGIDPRDDRRESRRMAKRKRATLGDLFAQWLEDVAKEKKKTWAEDERRFGRYCETFKRKTLSSIVREDIERLHAQVGRRGKYAANRLLALLSTVFEFGIKKDLVDTNPCKRVEKFPEKQRDRFLQPDEIGRFFGALAEEPVLFQDFFRLLLLTGARRGNVQEMRFEQIDFSCSTWRIPDTKAGEPQNVHLHRDAVEILQRRLTTSKDNAWVFPARYAGNKYEHITEPIPAFRRICKRAGLEDLRIHDLRRTLGSWQASTGASSLVIGKSLGHKHQASTEVYARVHLDPVRQAVDTAVDAMMTAAQAGGESASDDPDINFETE